MDYQILVLDLDGTLTNSKKEITEPTKQALIDIQEKGKKVVLASGRPTPGILPLAKELHLEKYGSYILSFNGAKIIDCRSKELLYNRTIPAEVIRPIYEMLKCYDMDLLTYTDTHILSGMKTNQFTELESRINQMPIVQTDDFLSEITFPLTVKYLSVRAFLLRNHAATH